MTKEEAIFLTCGFLGMIAHSLLRLQTLKADAKKANMTLSVQKWLDFDWPVLALSFVSVFIWYFTFKEVAAKYKGISEFTRVSFVAFGGLGSFIIQNFFSRAKDWIQKTIDKKTDIADGKT